MGSTWQSLLDDLWRVRCENVYRDDVSRREALIEQMAWTMQTILEKLRDRDDAPVHADNKDGS